MRTKTVTVNEGEYLGPIDWSFDFAGAGSDKGGSVNPEHVKSCVEMMRQLESGGEWEATTDGGWPRVGWGRVLRVGMYDGWPYWKPVPSVLTAGPLGSEWHSWCCLSEVRKIGGGA